MYCSIKEAAEIIGVSRPTVYAMIESGQLKRETLLGRPALKRTQVERVARTNGHKSGGPRKGVK